MLQLSWSAHTSKYNSSSYVVGTTWKTVHSIIKIIKNAETNVERGFSGVDAFQQVVELISKLFDATLNCSCNLVVGHLAELWHNVSQCWQHRLLLVQLARCRLTTDTTTTTSLCSATTYADNVPLPAAAPCCCSNRSTSPTRRAHSSKPTACCRCCWDKQADGQADGHRAVS